MFSSISTCFINTFSSVLPESFYLANNEKAHRKNQWNLALLAALFSSKLSLLRSTITSTIHTSLIIIDSMRLRTILQSTTALSRTTAKKFQKLRNNLKQPFPLLQ